MAGPLDFFAYIGLRSTCRRETVFPCYRKLVASLAFIHVVLVAAVVQTGITAYQFVALLWTLDFHIGLPLNLDGITTTDNIGADHALVGFTVPAFFGGKRSNLYHLAYTF